MTSSSGMKGLCLSVDSSRRQMFVLSDISSRIFRIFGPVDRPRRRHEEGLFSLRDAIRSVARIWFFTAAVLRHDVAMAGPDKIPGKGGHRTRWRRCTRNARRPGRCILRPSKVGSAPPVTDPLRGAGVSNH